MVSIWMDHYFQVVYELDGIWNVGAHIRTKMTLGYPLAPLPA